MAMNFSVLTLDTFFKIAPVHVSLCVDRVFVVDGVGEGFLHGAADVLLPDPVLHRLRLRRDDLRDLPLPHFLESGLFLQIRPGRQVKKYILLIFALNMCVCVGSTYSICLLLSSASLMSLSFLRAATRSLSASFSAIRSVSVSASRLASITAASPVSELRR